ncbi:hypothetical protein HYS82_03125 [Candidatus Amesbacteria bacterium]|nr:hypothetical protein [Candidatus Amesbacteria bacterium]
MGQDLATILWWWMTVFIVGAAAWPLTRRWFKNWHDQGYLMSKAVGIGLVTFAVYILGIFKVVSFNQTEIWVILVLVAGAGWKLTKKEKVDWKVIIAEEIFFGVALIFWSWIKAHEPMINGLEKFMDYGFTQSILKSKYFPPADMWFAGESINYYYFGHLMMAVLTKLSGLPLGYTFNLMLATIFALCLTMSYSIGKQVLSGVSGKLGVIGGLLIAFLVTSAGNLQTIYSFTEGYNGEDTPPPFWKMKWTFDGWKTYWYPNATRFIPYTIHEFPGYSFVVSDLHGHVLDIPLALLAIALIIKGLEGWEVGAFGWLAGLMFMTNALDGPIYLGLFAMITILGNFKSQFSSLKKVFNDSIKQITIAAAAFVITIVPFMVHFKPFVSGIAVNCPPAKLAATSADLINKIWPFVFETVDKCQKSPLWMMAVLWGFFAYCAVWLLMKEPKNKLFHLISFFCLLLIIFPEFFYFKDIYPLHFRSNTMFKLGYQAFMMMAIVSGYAIVKIRNKLFLAGLAPLLFLVSIYPYFAVRSYFGELKTYNGIYGLKWLEERYPDDWEAIKWLSKNIPEGQQPVVLEANGDSYTDYDRISAFSGYPTVAGWTVHEWLWRGSYDPIAKRAEDVRQIYEPADTETAKSLLAKYDVKYIVVGEMERQKYTQLDEGKIKKLGKRVFSSGTTQIYQVI